jgi:hypothetical protein
VVPTLTRSAEVFALAAAALLALGGPGGTGNTAVRAQSPATIYVERASLGGACSDARGAAAAAAPATPLCSITRALAAAPPGATVLVRAGSYPALSAGGARGATVTVAAYGAEAVRLPRISIANDAGFLRFQGLHLTGASNGPAFTIGDDAHDIQLVSSEVDDSDDAIIVRPGASNVLFEGNDISSRAPGATTGGIGLAFASTSRLPGSPPGEENDPPISNVTIRNNHFHDIGIDAIRPSNFVNLVVEGNDVEGLKENGEHCDVLQVTFGGRGFVFRDNYIHDNQSQGLFIKDGRVTNARVENNVFVRNSLEITVQFYDTVNLTLINNTVWDNESNVLLRAGIRNVVVRNNLFQRLDVDSTSEAAANVHQDYNLIAGGNWGARGPHDVRGAPKFVNAAGDDYRLAPGSRGVDAGTAEGAPPFDKACRPRYDAPALNRGAGDPAYVDMGALELSPSSTAGDTAARFDPGCAGGGPPADADGCRWLTVGAARAHAGSLRIRVAPRRTLTARVVARVLWTMAKGRRHADLRAVTVRLRTGHARTVRLTLGRAVRGAVARSRSVRVAVSIADADRSGCAVARTVGVRRV